MRNIVVFMFALMIFFVFPVQAQTPQVIQSCDKFTWDQNTEADLAGYRVYMKKDGVDQPVYTSAANHVGVYCSVLGVVEGHDYEVYLTAFNLGGLESLPSQTLVFSWPKPATTPTPPNAPKNYCFHGTIDGVPAQVCVPVTPQG